MDTKQQLQKLIDGIKTKQFRDSEAKGLMSSIQQEQTKALQPVLEQMARTMTDSMTRQFETAVRAIKIDVPHVSVDVPAPNFDSASLVEAIKGIKIVVPPISVNVPKLDLPVFNVPPSVMPDKMNTELSGVDRKNPLPVRLMDGEGKPFQFSLGTGGGKTDFLTIKGMGQSAFAEIMNPDGRLKVELPTGSSGLTDTELRASHLDVQQLSGAIDSVYVTGLTGTVGMVTINPDGLPTYASATSGLTDTELRASHLDVLQVSGAIDSVNVLTMPAVVVSSVTASIGAYVLDSAGNYRDTFPISGTVTGITNSIGVYNLDSAGNYKDTYPVSGSVSVSGITGSIGATILNGDGLARDTWGVNIVGATGSLAASIVDSSGVQYSGSNPVPVGDAGGSITVDGTFYQATQPVSIATMPSTPVTGTFWQATQPISGNIGTVTTVTGITNSLAVNIIDSAGVAYETVNPLPVTIISGASSTTAGTILNGDGTYRDTFPISGTITGITNSLAVNVVDSTGVAYETTNPLPTTLATALDLTIDSISVAQVSGANFSVNVLSGTTVVSSVTASTQATIIDSSGVGYSGSNPLPITLVSGALTSTIVVGPVVSDVADDGSAPVKGGGIARQANPTAVAAGDTVSSSYDDLGRQVMRPVQVRDLTVSAYASYATGTEATLLAATAGSLHDLVYILASNNSTAAIGIDIRPVLAGNIVMHLEIPANGVVGVATPVPYPQSASDTGNAWTVDLPDVTGTTVYVSALFSREI